MLNVYWRGETVAGCCTSAADEPPPPLAAPAPAAPELTLETNRRVSVVICTRDRPRQLARCLASLPAQRLAPSEIIVVDNASVTREAEALCREVGAIYVREDRPGLDIARNSGLRVATGAIIAYTDDDLVLHPDWLARLAAAFDRPEIKAVTGLVLPAELASPAQWYFEEFWGFGRGFERRDFDEMFYRRDLLDGCPAWEVGAGASMAFRREVFDEVGGFDERLDVGAAGCSGDSEMWHKILGAGGVCRYEPWAVAFHYHRRDWKALRAQLRAYMSGHAAALLVQYERTRHAGNIRRLAWVLPRYYLTQFLRRLAGRRRPGEAFLWDQVSGLVGGVAYYLRAPRPGTFS